MDIKKGCSRVKMHSIGFDTVNFINLSVYTLLIFKCQLQNFMQMLSVLLNRSALNCVSAVIQ